MCEAHTASPCIVQPNWNKTKQNRTEYGIIVITGKLHVYTFPERNMAQTIYVYIRCMTSSHIRFIHVYAYVRVRVRVRVCVCVCHRTQRKSTVNHSCNTQKCFLYSASHS